MADPSSPGPGVQTNSEAAFRDAKCFVCDVAFFVKNAKDPTEKPSGHFLRCIRCKNTFHAGCVQVTRARAKQLEDNYVCPFCVDSQPVRATAKKTSNGRVVRSSVTTKAPAPGSKRTQSTEPTQNINGLASDSACPEGKRTRTADGGSAEVNTGGESNVQAADHEPQPHVPTAAGPVQQAGQACGQAHGVPASDSGAEEKDAQLEAKFRALRDKEAELQARERALSDKFGQLEMEQRTLAESLEKFENEKQRFELQKSLIAGTLGSAGPLADGTKPKMPNDPFEAEKSVLRLAIQFQDWKIRRLIDQHSENRPAQSAATSVRSTEPTVHASMSFVEALKNVLQKFPDRQLATKTIALFETDVWSTTTAHEVHRFLEDRQLEATPLVSVIRKVAESACKGQGRSSGSA